MTPKKQIESPPAQPNSQCVSGGFPLSTPPSEEKTAAEEWVEAFDSDFWDDYPRKLGKFMARKAWMKIKPWNQQTCDEIFAGLARWTEFWANSDTDPQFIPYPATWLNQHRWEDNP